MTGVPQPLPPLSLSLSLSLSFSLVLSLIYPIYLSIPALVSISMATMGSSSSSARLSFFSRVITTYSPAVLPEVVEDAQQKYNASSTLSSSSSSSSSSSLSSPSSSLSPYVNPCVSLLALLALRHRGDEVQVASRLLLQGTIGR